MVVDWTQVVDSAVVETARNLPAIIVATATSIAMIISNWRQNVKTRNIIADGFKAAAIEMGKFQGFKEAIPLARADRQELLETVKEITRVQQTPLPLGMCALSTHAIRPHIQTAECVRWRAIEGP